VLPGEKRFCGNLLIPSRRTAGKQREYKKNNDAAGDVSGFHVIHL
jgi:hypothetical protein